MRTTKENLLNQSKEGDIIFIDKRSYGKWYQTIIPKLICYFTGATYHHVAAVKKQETTLVVIEAVFKGFVVTKSLEEFIEKDGQEYDLLYVSREDYVKNLKFKFLLLEGNPYDFGSLFIWQLIDKAYYKLFNRNLWLGRKGISAIKTIYCSEALAFMYELDEWWKVGPKELLDALKKKEYTIYKLK